MRIADSARVFEQFLAARGTDLADLTASQAVSAMAQFYREQRADDAAGLDEDGDGLLVQWGVYDFDEDEDGATFQFDLTRQFIEPGEDAEMWQLSLTLHFEADDRLRSIEPDDHWCFDPTDLDALTSLAAGSAPMAAIGEEPSSRVDLHLGLV